MICITVEIGLSCCLVHITPDYVKPNLTALGAVGGVQFEYEMIYHIQKPILACSSPKI